MTTSIQESLQNHFNTFTQLVKPYCDRVNSFYKQTKRKGVVLLEQRLPDNLKPLAKRIVNSIPETLFTACLFTGKCMTPAALFWTAKMIIVLTPFFKVVVKGDFKLVSLQKAAQESLDKLLSAYERVIPGLLVACSVGVVVCGLSGVFGRSPMLLMQGSFFAALAYLAYQHIAYQHLADQPPAAQASQPSAAAAPAVPVAVSAAPVQQASISAAVTSAQT